MRPDAVPSLFVWLQARYGVLLSLPILVLVLGCPSGRTDGGAMQSSGSISTPGDPCHRSLEGDLNTIRSRMERKRPAEAKVYVEALAGCPQVSQSVRYLMLSSQVYEELGELNAAWTATTHALRFAADQSERQIIKELQGRLSRFEEHYVRILGGGPSALAPRIRYAGAVLDDVTFAQLAVVADNRYVELGPGQWGFWLYPGRYHVQGVEQVLKAGTRVDLRLGSD